MSDGATTIPQEGGTDSGGAAAPDLVERARSLQPLLDQEAAAAEAEGKLTDAVDDALHENGIFGMWVPRSLGGSELNPTASLDVISALAYGDASTGWVVMAASLAIGTGAAYLADEAVAELFDGDRMPVIAGQGTRPGTAVREADGLRLSGNWSFASGIKHSSHIHTLGIIEDTGEPRIFVLPVEQATLIDNWDVLGLRATGSIDYTIDGALVKDEYTHFALSQDAKRGNLYRLGIINFAGICHSAWALGVGRRALDELKAYVRGKVGRPGQSLESDQFQGEFAVAEAKLRSARAFVYETWGDVEETIGRGEVPSVRQDTLIRLGMAHATWTAHDVVMFVYKWSGTTALRSGKIQQLFRDMHAGTQHITSSPPVLQATGQELAGLAEGKVWQLVSLVDPS